MDPSHRTALAEAACPDPSASPSPTRSATPERSVFDYGCGRGDDLRPTHPQHRAYTATGWDPNFQPAIPQQPADLVNLGYVINVIENPLERRQALQSAWQLARQVLVVAARLGDEKDVTKLTPFADGWLTGRNTFQKFYDQVELRNYINSTLQVESVAAGPACSTSSATSFKSSRGSWRPASGVGLPGSPDGGISDELFEAHRPLLEPLMAFFTDRVASPRRTSSPTRSATCVLPSDRYAGRSAPSSPSPARRSGTRSAAGAVRT